MGSPALAETDAVACKPKYRRLTSADFAYMLSLEKQGLTQAEIAQRLGCTQQAVSQWLKQCQDSTASATLYLRGAALKMAQNVVKKGKPDVQLKALQGLGVAADGEQKQGLTIQIGGNAGQVKVGIVVQADGLSPTVTNDLHKLSAEP